MALAVVHGAVVSGVSGCVVRVEVDVSDGLPAVGVIGLPDTSVSEARWRARCAIVSSGATWPNKRLTISLSPAEIRKQGAGLDLPIAVGVLAASEQVPHRHLPTTAFIGELGLDGRIRATPGTLPGAIAARQAGIATVVVPVDGARELRRLSGIRIAVVERLVDVVTLLASHDPPGQESQGGCDDESAVDGPDLRDVRGHALGRLALEVAAAGGHHCALVGPPGVGKTLLAERLVGLLPDLGDADALEVAALHSISGRARPDAEYRRPPARAPHHSASAAAVLGTVRGSRVVPGAVTLAHGGVLFLDEAPEFARPALEGMRQPLESGWLAVDRSGWSGLVPARFQLVVAANPCPCGMRVGTGRGCQCSPAAVRRYAARLSGPMMDRIDIRLSVSRPTDAELAGHVVGEGSAQVRERVLEARARSARRLAGTPWSVNARVATGTLRREFAPDPAGAAVLHELERGSTNLRGPDRVLRVAWTLADLGGRDRPGADEIAAATGLRGAGIPWLA